MALGHHPLTTFPISTISTGAAPPPVDLTHAPVIVLQTISRVQRPITQGATIVRGGEFVAAPNELATKPVIVLDTSRQTTQAPIIKTGTEDVYTAPYTFNNISQAVERALLPPTPAPIIRRGSLVDEYFAPYTFNNISQAVERALYPTTQAPIIKIGTEDIYSAPYTFNNISQAVERLNLPVTPKPIIVRGSEDAVVVENEASPKPVIVLDASRPTTQAPIIKIGTQDVYTAPYTFNNISQAVARAIRPTVPAPIIKIGTEDAVVVENQASPKPVIASQAVPRVLAQINFDPIIKIGTQDVYTAPYTFNNISQAVARSTRTQIFGTIILRGNDGGVVPPAPEEDRGKSGWDPHYYKRRNKRRVSKEDIKKFLEETENAPKTALPQDIAAQQESARLAALAALEGSIANNTKIALQEINSFYSLLRRAIKQRQDAIELDDDEDEDILLLISADLF